MWIVLQLLKRARLQARSRSDLASTNVLDGRTQYPHGDVKRWVGGHVGDQCKHVHDSDNNIFCSKAGAGRQKTCRRWSNSYYRYMDELLPFEATYNLRSKPPWSMLKKPLLGRLG